MSKLKLMTILGTRPEIIRLSAVIRTADKYFDHVLVHTGQNYDPNLNDIFFKELEMKSLVGLPGRRPGIKPPFFFKLLATSTGLKEIAK
jgi:UDP-N-acetylglucosamine 2-epimerase